MWQRMSSSSPPWLTCARKAGHIIRLPIEGYTKNNTLILPLHSDAEVHAARQERVRKRMQKEKEIREKKEQVRRTEREIRHGTKDEPFFARKYLDATSVANKRCPCGHKFGSTAGNHQAWMHFTSPDPQKPSPHEREVAANAREGDYKPRLMTSFFPH